MDVEAAALEVMRSHTIDAFNGTQVACRRCWRWMTTDEYHQHLAELISAEVSAP